MSKGQGMHLTFAQQGCTLMRLTLSKLSSDKLAAYFGSCGASAAHVLCAVNSKPHASIVDQEVAAPAAFSHVVLFCIFDVALELAAKVLPGALAACLCCWCAC